MKIYSLAFLFCIKIQKSLLIFKIFYCKINSYIFKQKKKKSDFSASLVIHTYIYLACYVWRHLSKLNSAIILKYENEIFDLHIDSDTFLHLS